ncbi:PAS domain S-box protein, partial [Candidatus Bipolaricaulota bacterium]|nr:PAS domain S-box protein [Candidatus Bipolaricaulota bacterium]
MNTDQLNAVLIEDNPGDVRLIEEMLKDGEALSVKLNPAGRLSEGLQIVANNCIDLILLDLGLPESQGLKTLTKTKEEVKDIPILVITGLAQEEAGIKAIQNGAQDYLIKGEIDSETLERSIRYAVERYRMERKTEYLNSLLRSIREVNQAIVRETDMLKIVNKACKVLVETQGYLDARIALLEEDISFITPKAHSGSHKLLKEWELTPNGEGYGPKCVKEVLEKKAPKVIKSTKTYCKGCEYCPHDRDHQVVVTPVIYRGNLVGILSTCIEEGLKIDQKQTDLLKEIAEDLGMARSEKLLEQSLKESEKKYREIFNNANDAIYLHTLTDDRMPGEFVEVNDVACEMLGYTKEELISMSPQEIKDPNMTKKLPGIMETLLEEESVTFEMKHVAKDGSRIPVEISSHVFFLHREKHVLSIARDITKRKKAQQKLQQREQQLEESFTQLAETTSRVLGVRDPYTQEHEQRVAGLAQEVGNRMGLEKDELLGLYLGGVLHDIGKIIVPETILTKPGELKDVEWEMIRSHPEVGYNQIL